MSDKYDAKELRERVLKSVAILMPQDIMLALLDSLEALGHANESWRLIDEQNHRDLERYESALKRLAEMDYACDDKDCAASDVANEALSPAKD